MEFHANSGVLLITLDNMGKENEHRVSNSKLWHCIKPPERHLP